MVVRRFTSSCVTQIYNLDANSNRMFPRAKPRILIGLLAITSTLLLLITLHSGREVFSAQQNGHLRRMEAVHVDDGDCHISAADRFILEFTLKGHHFNSSGVFKEYSHPLVSSLIHSYSPYTENRFREIILEPRQEQRVYANSPALLCHNGELITVMRIWLEKEIYREEKAPKPKNDFSDNFLYIQKFNRQMKPITPGSVMGLPTPRQWIVGDGPIEPRFFKMDADNIFITYNTGAYMQDGKALDSTFVWDYKRHKTLIPSIKGGSPILKNVEPDRMPRDKHWTPYNDRGTLRMVYNVDPLRVLECNLNFSCEFVHFEGPDNFQFNQQRDSSRGGTPWILYKYPYYISIGHTTLFKKVSWDRIYNINLIVYKAVPVTRIVYISGPIQIHNEPMKGVPIVRKDYIEDPFFFPVSILQEDEDSIVIGGHINDFSSVLIRVRGIKRILEDILAEDSELPATMNGPPMGTIQHSAKHFATLFTGMEWAGLSD